MNLNLLQEEESLEYIKKRKPSLDPKCRFDYQKIMATITKKPLGRIFKETEGWPMDFFYTIQSYCKEKKTEEAKAKFVNWFIKNCWELEPKNIQ